jgi:hypothetical protein
MDDYLDDIGPGYCGCAHEVPVDDDRHQLWRQQRTKRGFDDTELWSLDDTILEFILPRLDEFRKNLIGHPPMLTADEWDGILDRIVTGIKDRLDDDSYYIKPNEYHEETLRLLFKWFGHLWD